MTEPIVTDDEVIEPPKSKREQDYENLLANRAAEREVPEIEEPVIDEPEKKEPETIELVGEDGNPIHVPINAKYKAKVDGEEVEVQFDKLARSYQIGAAADKRMKDVTEKQKELERRERDLESRGQELTQKEKDYLETQKKIEAQNEAGQIDDTKYKDLSKKLLSALTDEDDPESAIESVLREMTPEGVDAQAITEQAQKKALEAVEERERKRKEEAEAKRLERIENARIEANQKFEKALDNEFKILKEDQDLMRLAKSYANEDFGQNPEKDPWEVITSAFDKVVEFQKRVTPDSGKPPKTPKSVSARASIGEDKKPQTRSETLNEMKKSRGQPIAL
jgi:hypothetical protein